MADQTEPRNLAELLQDISGGDFHNAATNKLTDLVATMKEVERNQGGKPKGRLTITLSLELDRGMIEIDGSVKVSEPSTVNGRTFMYGNPDGTLVKEDPRQHALALGAGESRDGVPDIRERQAGR